MKRNFIALVVVVMVAFTFVVNAAVVERLVLSDKTANRLSASEVANLWTRPSSSVARGRVAANGYPTITQAVATIEVVSSPNGETYALFQTLTPPPFGSFIAFRMVQPDGTVVPLSGFTVQSEYNWHVQLLNGQFPGVWPGGWTKLEAIILSSKGELSYVSSLVPVGTCCALTGPIQRVDVSMDGMSIKLMGSFKGLTTATLNGQEVPFIVVYSPVNGIAIGSVTNSVGANGQTTLTICSEGECSTRVIYLAVGTSTTPLPSTPPK